jgi:hypothetical protein
MVLRTSTYARTQRDDAHDMLWCIFNAVTPRVLHRIPSSSASVSAAAAGATSDGCAGSEDTAGAKGHPRSPPEGDPTLIRRRHVDRLSPNVSPTGRLPESITKANEGYRGERGAKGSLVLCRTKMNR